ncbi:hypothetical protein SKAU_G00018150 [Synaphobranchus kaupii]|uniref:Uncharacterized protein n=1 Tax=Synaphobranchus kaupii TaxID=118154 RepID=A0A9Q1GBM4_SYNKA|nr:hypothetical protein SKAU_G00018150 [Synaphobranchus kaupii]
MGTDKDAHSQHGSPDGGLCPDQESTQMQHVWPFTLEPANPPPIPRQPSSKGHGGRLATSLLMHRTQRHEGRGLFRSPLISWSLYRDSSGIIRAGALRRWQCSRVPPRLTTQHYSLLPCPKSWVPGAPAGSNLLLAA